MGKKSLQLRAGLVVVLVFVVGFLAGIGATAAFLIVNGPGLPFFRNQPPFGSPGMFIEKMMRELHLSESQKKEVDAILRQTKDDIAKLRGQTEPKMRSILDKTKKSIGAVLTDEQKNEFEGLMASSRKHMEKMWKKEGGRPPAPPGDMPPPPPPHHYGDEPSGMEPGFMPPFGDMPPPPDGRPHPQGEAPDR